MPSTGSSERIGQTETILPDGRVVLIGGAHEGLPTDTRVYNDVIVFKARTDGKEHRAVGHMRQQVKEDEARKYSRDTKPFDAVVRMLNSWSYMADGKFCYPDEEFKDADWAADEVKVYGYPEEVFPATLNHVAIHQKAADGKDFIWIIKDNVYRLDLQDYSIQHVPTTGQGPSREAFEALYKRTIYNDQTNKSDHQTFKLSCAEGIFTLSVPEMKWTVVQTQPDETDPEMVEAAKDEAATRSTVQIEGNVGSPVEDGWTRVKPRGGHLQ